MTVRWGVLGTGGIAAAFATDLELLPGAEIVAVGSRTAARAQAFGDRFGIGNRHDSYRALVRDPQVEVVYVATPHSCHHRDARLAIEAGKAVLVEKPFTLNAGQARDLVAAAQANGTFLMEAMWTRFLPHMRLIRELVGAGRLGEVRSLTADFGEWFAPDASHRAYAPELGGGALLDLGVYPLALASMIFGAPGRVTAASQPAFTGVDAQTGVLLSYPGGGLAVLLASLEAHTASTASINGTRGRIEVAGDFLAPAPITLIEADGEVTVFDAVHQGRGLRHQAAEVGRCLRAGLTESPVLPLSETVTIMETLDEIRRQIGLRYPGEGQARPSDAPPR